MSAPRPVINPTVRQSEVMANNSAATNGHEHHKHHHIWLVTGPAGCGKTTVAKHVADNLNMPYIEGDEFHPPQNIEKMSNGIPLTDADRWDWLTRLREEALKQLELGNDGVVVTCSALKRKYRDVIRVAPYFSPGLQLHFIYLHAPEEVLLRRVAARKGHYMGFQMVHSQFAILEPPSAEEKDVISLDVSGSIDEVSQDALEQVSKKLEEDAA
ncbi:hypothetical protein VM1G_01768 [Cytospora mali]|uniref:Gluconokinase n=1 Tax=Cytospora mali TaxID=578113 RepID=A0A194VQI4_CYTMA|nr:hypothetical protein VM1G_01768 [Valsa mali]